MGWGVWGRGGWERVWRFVGADCVCWLCVCASVQVRVRTWFNQPGKKRSRRLKRDAKVRSRAEMQPGARQPRVEGRRAAAPPGHGTPTGGAGAGEAGLPRCWPSRSRVRGRRARNHGGKPWAPAVQAANNGVWHVVRNHAGREELPAPGRRSPAPRSPPADAALQHEAARRQGVHP